MLRSILRVSARRFARSVQSSASSSALGSLLAVVVVLAAGWLVAACSPTYDWRTIMNNDNGYTVDLPAKPTSDERQIDIDGTPMKMAMQIAEAGDAVFAVGTVMLPSDDPQVQRMALDYLRAGLARNLGTAPNAHAKAIPLAAGGQVQGLEMTFSGKAGPKQEARTMHARLVAKGRHVYQAAVIASKEPPPDQVEQFFESFKLY
ncbi:hypothetical protein [Paraburkholderia diazotrophica]|uniref:Transmembrane protein n=1 Tax=Paraburkholderia diazotrophica TaxID=667676 RepID=A0A1H6RR82_9BURK|nr:hypothetical protein [Paraburkholderia diazotrophica]SEI54310.1 hypothetical protein SAMN05192539_1002258 [Paraburkholderia diazotrophica]